ncbi:transcriptional regulator, AraC family [Arcobacter nitrofigilis DSM 7299]|uniref:Transcriptional regulator, AraC family n=1 Tax=Arcobacter nitrofigilis (strain ATCC 33309 / DSM 7299 / CCUG 15893 / LMG 7604 / NCTC 12251 / CI) TaxID=572480 RepID=D5V3Z9_ARCNC|nr:AraC family transcriptional regulator [Arcobacter nitrofigilis]ADG92827.1 transcriptional regulator, AraC family [Arcobacter nitrofigilis DSM 7299]
MIITLPHYIFENKESYQIINDDSVIVAKSTRYKKDKISLRNSMHLAILLINGGKILHLKDDVISIDTSDILFLSQGNYFMGETLGDKNNFEAILIYFDDEYVFNFIKRYNITIETLTQNGILSFKRDEFINNCAQTINQYFLTNIKNSLDLVKLKLDEIFLYSLSKDKEKFTAFLNKIVQTKSSRIKYILEENLDIINNIDDMCKLTRLNSKALRKEVNRLYNQNPKEWLDERRLSFAVTLLKNTQKSVSQIASSCGYSSVSWFIIQFKKYYKTTPLLYREQNL